jgi:hypothetical protein
VILDVRAVADEKPGLDKPLTVSAKGISSIIGAIGSATECSWAIPGNVGITVATCRDSHASHSFHSNSFFVNDRADLAVREM